MRSCDCGLSMWMGCALHVPPASSTRRRSWWAASASSDANVTTVIDCVLREVRSSARRGVGAEQRAGPLEQGEARRREQDPREREALLLRQREHVVPVALDVEATGARDHLLDPDRAQHRGDARIVDTRCSRSVRSSASRSVPGGR